MRLAAQPAAVAVAAIRPLPPAGTSLPAALRRTMDRSLGHDFSAIRVGQSSELGSEGVLARTRGNVVKTDTGLEDEAGHAGHLASVGQQVESIGSRRQAGHSRPPAAPVADRAALPVQAKGKSKSFKRRRRADLAQRAAVRERIGVSRSPLTRSMLTQGRANLRRIDRANVSAEFRGFEAIRDQNQPAHDFVDFATDTRRAVTTLASQPEGQLMLSEIDSAPGDPARIRFRRSQANSADYRHPPPPGPSPAYRRDDGAPGHGGVGSDVNWNPDDGILSGNDRQAFIGLGHELVHAWRGRHGEAVRRMPAAQLFNGDFKANNALRDAQTRQDEGETVGLVRPPRRMPNENLIRGEHLHRPRRSYGDFVRPQSDEQVADVSEATRRTRRVIRRRGG